MKAVNRQRQLILFLIALVLPSLVVVAFGLRMVAQDREIAEKRATDAQRRAVAEIRQQILGRLERIKLQEISAIPITESASPWRSTNPAVALVAWAEGDRLLLPWDLDQGTSRFRRAVQEAGFSQRIEAAEYAELVCRVLADAEYNGSSSA
jgi:hypothetical protein